jgi:hypothetical protein
MSIVRKLFSWFRNKKALARPEPRRLAIPEDKVREIRVLHDKFHRAPSYSDKAAHYDFWSAIVEIYPEVSGGKWTVEFPSALAVVVVEQLEDL